MTTTQTKPYVQLAEDVITAFNGADWAQLRSIFAPHVVYTETGTQRRVENLEENTHVRSNFTGQFQIQCLS